jgi:antitoxin component of MazEF toxin-antitoxin module
MKSRATVKIAEDGGLVLPKAVCEAAGIAGETRVSIRVEDGEVRLSPAERNVARAQELYRKHVKRDFTSDEFLATRDGD